MNAGSETSTLVADLARTVHSLSGSPALCFHDGHRWGPVTWAEHGRRVRHITLGLDAAGVGPGARVAVAVDRGPTRRAADLAVLCAGGVLVGPSSREPHVVVDAVELDAMVEAGGEIDGGQPDRFERLKARRRSA